MGDNKVNIIDLTPWAFVDTTSFGIEIAKQIDGLRKGIEGFFNYNDGPIEFLIPNNISPEEVFNHLDKHAESEQLDLSNFMVGMDTPQTNSIFLRKGGNFKKRMSIDGYGSPIMTQIQ